MTSTKFTISQPIGTIIYFWANLSPLRTLYVIVPFQVCPKSAEARPDGQSGEKPEGRHRRAEVRTGLLWLQAGELVLHGERHLAGERGADEEDQRHLLRQGRYNMYRPHLARIQKCANFAAEPLIS